MTVIENDWNCQPSGQAATNTEWATKNLLMQTDAKESPQTILKVQYAAYICVPTLSLSWEQAKLVMLADSVLRLVLYTEERH